MKRLRFSVAIAASRRDVWNTMLEPDSYRAWTAAFVEGSYYEGSWEKGARIRFLSAGGDGMTSEIVENRPCEFVSIRNLGIIKDGVDDTESPAARAWTPAYENYTFTEKGGVTEVVVDVDVNERYEKIFSDPWPKALQRLKEICER